MDWCFAAFAEQHKRPNKGAIWLKRDAMVDRRLALSSH